MTRDSDDRRIKLGCVIPGEPVAVFGDAMRRMSASATYLYQDGSRYWYSTQPTVATLAEARAQEYRRNRYEVDQEIKRRLETDLRSRGDFNRIHVFPSCGHEVQDNFDASLVVLGPSHPHTRDGASDSSAIAAAQLILESRGNTPRLFRNTLAFMAADDTRLQDLEEAIRRYLAWQSIIADKETLDLPPHQVRQAEVQRTAAEDAVVARIGETYQWLLVPTQSTPQSEVQLNAVRLTGQGALAERASRRMLNDELLITSFAGTRLRMELDRIPLWRGKHVAIRQLLDDFAPYIYLPRLKEPAVLLKAIGNGLSLLTWEQDSFAYADSYDDGSQRYQGLHHGARAALLEHDSGFLVRPEVARSQLDSEARASEAGHEASESESTSYKRADDSGEIREPSGGKLESPPVQPKARRYHGSVQLDPTRVGRNASQIADEVIAHLSGLMGADVNLTLEIEANIPDGAPEHVVRIVIENSRSLKFEDSGFENA